MMLYDCAIAPGPRRVRIFLAEKGIAVPVTEVDIRDGAQFSAAFRALNPDCTVPLLAFDSGVRLADPIAICEYFEAIQPEPRLLGDGAEDRAIVSGWQRRAERDGYYAVMEAFRNASPRHIGRGLPGPIDYAQIPALAERGRARTLAFFAMMDAHLADRPYVAGARYSIADITTLITLDWAAARLDLRPPEAAANLRAWHARAAARPGSVS